MSKARCQRCGYTKESGYDGEICPRCGSRLLLVPIRINDDMM